MLVESGSMSPTNPATASIADKAKEKENEDKNREYESFPSTSYDTTTISRSRFTILDTNTKGGKGRIQTKEERTIEELDLNEADNHLFLPPPSSSNQDPRHSTVCATSSTQILFTNNGNKNSENGKINEFSVPLQKVYENNTTVNFVDGTITEDMTRKLQPLEEEAAPAKIATTANLKIKKKTKTKKMEKYSEQSNFNAAEAISPIKETASTSPSVSLFSSSSSPIPALALFHRFRQEKNQQQLPILKPSQQLYFFCNERFIFFAGISALHVLFTYPFLISSVIIALACICRASVLKEYHVQSIACKLSIFLILFCTNFYRYIYADNKFSTKTVSISTNSGGEGTISSLFLLQFVLLLQGALLTIYSKTFVETVDLDVSTLLVKVLCFFFPTLSVYIFVSTVVIPKWCILNQDSLFGAPFKALIHFLSLLFVLKYYGTHLKHSPFIVGDHTIIKGSSLNYGDYLVKDKNDEDTYDGVGQTKGRKNFSVKKRNGKGKDFSHHHNETGYKSSTSASVTSSLYLELKETFIFSLCIGIILVPVFVYIGNTTVYTKADPQLNGNLEVLFSQKDNCVVLAFLSIGLFTFYQFYICGEKHEQEIMNAFEGLYHVLKSSLVFICKLMTTSDSQEKKRKTTLNRMKDKPENLSKPNVGNEEIQIFRILKKIDNMITNQFIGENVHLLGSIIFYTIFVSIINTNFLWYRIIPNLCSIYYDHISSPNEKEKATETYNTNINDNQQVSLRICLSMVVTIFAYTWRNQTSKKFYSHHKYLSILAAILLYIVAPSLPLWCLPSFLTSHFSFLLFVCHLNEKKQLRRDKVDFGGVFSLSFKFKGFLRKIIEQIKDMYGVLFFIGNIVIMSAFCFLTLLQVDDFRFSSRTKDKDGLKAEIVIKSLLIIFLITTYMVLYFKGEANNTSYESQKRFFLGESITNSENLFKEMEMTRRNVMMVITSFLSIFFVFLEGSIFTAEYFSQKETNVKIDYFHFSEENHLVNLNMPAGADEVNTSTFYEATELPFPSMKFPFYREECVYLSSIFIVILTIHLISFPISSSTITRKIENEIYYQVKDRSMPNAMNTDDHISRTPFKPVTVADLSLDLKTICKSNSSLINILYRFNITIALVKPFVLICLLQQDGLKYDITYFNKEYSHQKGLYFGLYGTMAILSAFVIFVGLPLRYPLLSIIYPDTQDVPYLLSTTRNSKVTKEKSVTNHANSIGETEYWSHISFHSFFFRKLSYENIINVDQLLTDCQKIINHNLKFNSKQQVDKSDSKVREDRKNDCSNENNTSTIAMTATGMEKQTKNDEDDFHFLYFPSKDYMTKESSAPLKWSFSVFVSIAILGTLLSTMRTILEPIIYFLFRRHALTSEILGTVILFWSLYTGTLLQYTQPPKVVKQKDLQISQFESTGQASIVNTENTSLLVTIKRFCIFTTLIGLGCLIHTPIHVSVDGWNVSFSFAFCKQWVGLLACVTLASILPKIGIISRRKAPTTWSILFLLGALFFGSLCAHFILPYEILEVSLLQEILSSSDISSNENMKSIHYFSSVDVIFNLIQEYTRRQSLHFHELLAHVGTIISIAAAFASILSIVDKNIFASNRTYLICLIFTIITAFSQWNMSAFFNSGSSLMKIEEVQLTQSSVGIGEVEMFHIPTQSQHYQEENKICSHILILFAAIHAIIAFMYRISGVFSSSVSTPSKLSPFRRERASSYSNFSKQLQSNFKGRFGIGPQYQQHHYENQQQNYSDLHENPFVVRGQDYMYFPLSVSFCFALLTVHLMCPPYKPFLRLLLFSLISLPWAWVDFQELSSCYRKYWRTSNVRKGSMSDIHFRRSFSTETTKGIGNDEFLSFTRTYMESTTLRNTVPASVPLSLMKNDKENSRKQNKFARLAFLPIFFVYWCLTLQPLYIIFMDNCPLLQILTINMSTRPQFHGDFGQKQQIFDNHHKSYSLSNMNPLRSNWLLRSDHKIFSIWMSDSLYPPLLELFFLMLISIPIFHLLYLTEVTLVDKEHYTVYLDSLTAASLKASKNTHKTTIMLYFIACFIVLFMANLIQLRLLALLSLLATTIQSLIFRHIRKKYHLKNH